MRKAPDFTLPDQTGTKRSLGDFSGNWLIVYFYPKDNTLGCTTEACNFRDGRDLLKSLGAEIVGISKDSVKSHQKFADSHSLNFTLLSNPEHDVIEAYGAWGVKKFMGRTFHGILRNTYLVNPEGMIVKEYEGVNPKSHFQEIYEDLKSLQAA